MTKVKYVKYKHITNLVDTEPKKAWLSIGRTSRVEQFILETIVKMEKMKTHIEFLKVLKRHLRLRIAQCNDMKEYFSRERQFAYEDILDQIEYFEEQLRGDKEDVDERD